MKACDCSDRTYDYSELKEFMSGKVLKEMGSACSCILNIDLLVFPVHLKQREVPGSHWACAVVNQRDHCITYFDSNGVCYY